MVDHFHLVRVANTALDSVARERHRCRPKGAPFGQGRQLAHDLYRDRHRLLKVNER